MKRVLMILAVFCLLPALVFAGGQSDGTAAGGSAVPQIVRAPTIMGGTYMDMMKTMYDKAGQADILQIPMTAYDKNMKVNPIAAEGWDVSADGLTWTFRLRKNLKWSDGVDLTAEDFVFALERAVTEGYDFAWFWSWAGGIKNWGDVESGKLPLSEFGVKMVDKYTITVTTASPKPYLDGIAAYWWAVPKHVVKKYGNEWASSDKNYVSSGPFMLKSWVRGDKMVMVKNPNYFGPWPTDLEAVELYPALEDPAVAFPAYLAGDLDIASLNAGQLAFARQRFPDDLKSSPFYGTYYLAFDYDVPPFNDVNVRKAIFYAIDRDKAANTVLQNVAIPARGLYPPGFPGYTDAIAKQTGFDPVKAREYLAKAGFAGGKGFPKVELWWRIEGGIHAPIVGPAAQFVQAQLKENLGIDIEVRGIELKTWMDGLKEKTNNFFLAPYMYDYVDASNFAGIFVNGGRHHWVNDRYTQLINKADTLTKWADREKLYQEAEQIIVDNAVATYLFHPITNGLQKSYIKGPGVEPNDFGLYNSMPLYLYSHIHIEK